MGNDATIYLLDQVVPKAGRGQQFLNAYMQRYAPGAEARGMKLEFTWITPPLWLDNQVNTLFFIWSMRGVAGWWAMQMHARRDPSLADWWRDAEQMIESRQRRFLANISDVTSLTHV
jgi:hypothetical protein